MPVLKSLSFTALPKTGNDPVLARRAKFATKLEEQKLLLKDPNHVPLYAGEKFAQLSNHPHVDQIDRRVIEGRSP
jgi:hypothetical protein